jgi:hypothetical protein
VLKSKYAAFSRSDAPEVSFQNGVASAVPVPKNSDGYGAQSCIARLEFTPTSGPVAPAVTSVPIDALPAVPP